MEGFTIIDGVVAVVILVSAILSYARGFVRETLSIVAWVGSAVVAYLFTPTAEPLIRELPVVGEFLENCQLSTIAAFFVVFVLALVIFSIFTPLFSSVIQRSALNGLDQAAGFLFGAARGVLIAVVGFVIYDWVVGVDVIPMVEDSRSSEIFANLQEQLAGEIDDQQQIVQWITQRYETLIDSTCGPSTTPAEAAPAQSDTNTTAN